MYSCTVTCFSNYSDVPIIASFLEMLLLKIYYYAPIMCLFALCDISISMWYIYPIYALVSIRRKKLSFIDKCKLATIFSSFCLAQIFFLKVYLLFRAKSLVFQSKLDAFLILPMV